MKAVTILLLFIHCLDKGGCWAFGVEGHVGGTIIIKCKYDQKQSHKPKYFCKNKAYGGTLLCDEQIRAEGDKGWCSKGRFSLYDDKKRGLFKVIMRDLTKRDEGKYWCAVDNNMWTDEYTEINLKVKEEDKVYKVSGYIGHDINIKCKYEIDNKKDSKYLCKNTTSGCEDKILTDKKDQWESRDRFSLYDNTTGGFFMVSITELTKEDAGMYWCAVDMPFSSGSALAVDTFKAVQLDITTVGEPQINQVVGYVGGAVMIKSNFSHGHQKSYKKYFCKMNSPGPGCEVKKIITAVNDKWEISGHFSLYYNSSGKFSLVKIRQLTKEDAGNYQCAVDMPFMYNRKVTVDEHTETSLRVEDAFSEKQIQTNADVGEQVNITCKYPGQHKQRPKFFCREYNHNECRYRFTSQHRRGKTEPDRYSLYDDTEHSVLVVSFRNVTTADSGQYWCGVEFNWESGGYKAYITNISLSVRVSSSKPTTSTVTSVGITKAQTHSSPVGLSVFLCLMVVVFGIIFFICIRCKKSRSKEPNSNHQHTAQGKIRVSANADCDYEEVKDTSISASGTSTVDTKPQLPTNPCQDPTYSNCPATHEPTGEPAYSTVKLPVDQSEGSSYASVTFQKNLSSNDDLVTLNRDKLSCDYTTVKYLYVPHGL